MDNLEEMENPRVSRRKEIIIIRAEINAKETKETVAKINEAKSWFFERLYVLDFFCLSQLGGCKKSYA